MHEFSIAAGLVEKLLDFGEKNPEKKIVEVRVAIGELTQVEDKQLTFCYNSIINETALEGSILQLEKIAARVKCPYCGFEGAAKYWDGILPGVPIATLECSGCGKAAEPIEGHDCAIKSIRFQQIEPAIF